MFDKPIDHGFYEITERQARKLCGGTLPRPGHERLVAHEGKHYWVGRTRNWGSQLVWYVKEARGWRLENGQAVSGGHRD